VAREPASPPATDPVESARAARLRYVIDSSPGIRRLRSGKGFRFVDAAGGIVSDPGELRRFRALAVPPAWTDVWICPHANGHLQATGRDARRRKQYRYHKDWRQVRDETKYTRMVAFGEILPKIRRRVERDLALAGLPREKVLATVVRLLDLTSIRVGNEEYARANRSFGLTTLRNHHVDVSGARIQFQFRGKSGKPQSVEVTDRRLARIVKRCQDIPGYELFQYIDEGGARQSIGSADVNAYLREIGGEDFTAKDFRTWAGTVQTLAALRELGPASSATAAKRNVVSAVARAAEMLGNTAAICRRCYVHPAVIEAYTNGGLEGLSASRPPRSGLSEGEPVLLDFLRRWLRADLAPLASKLRASLSAKARGRRRRPSSIVRSGLRSRR
jgi:DNA topoisomerase-1